MQNSWKYSDLKPLREKKDDQYEPQEQEIREYAEYIGINLDQEQYLIEVAVQGVKAQLPVDWEACQTPQGEIVYRNKKTRAIQQQHPQDQNYRRKVIELRKQYKLYLQSQQYQQEGSEASELNTIPEQKSQKSEEKVHIDQIIPSVEIFRPGNTLALERSSKLNNAVYYEHSGQLKDSSSQNSKVLDNMISKQYTQRIKTDEISLLRKQKQKKFRKQALLQEIKNLRQQQKLAKQLLDELQSSNREKALKLKNKLKH